MTSLSVGGVEGIGMEGGRGRYRDVRARYRVPRVDPRGRGVTSFVGRSLPLRGEQRNGEGGVEDRGGDR